MTVHKLLLGIVFAFGSAKSSVSFISGPPTALSAIKPKPPLSLHAKKSPKQKKKSRQNRKDKYASTSGFGGAATAPCPCGSGVGYAKCCGKLHKDPGAYASATAEQVVRARYSAYAKREVDFIVGSTHPLNKNFQSDIEHWKDTIRMNCYDNFELTSCEIMEESYVGEGEQEVARVKFVAKMVQVDSREKTAFMETSIFERAGKHLQTGHGLTKMVLSRRLQGCQSLQIQKRASQKQTKPRKWNWHHKLVERNGITFMLE